MRSLFIFILLALSGMTGKAWANDYVVIIAASSEIKALSRDEVVNIFMGRYRRLPSGLVAYPLDLPPDDGQELADQLGKAGFYEALLGKSLSEINAYWARLVFSGNTSPPRRVANHQEMLSAVANTSGAVGYLPRGALKNKGTKVRVVLELKGH